MLSSASTETATDLAPVKSASTPTAPPEAAVITQVFNRIYSFRSGQSYLDVTVKTNKDTTKENTYFYGRISAYRSGDRISGSSAQIQYLKDVSTSSSSTYTISRRSSSTINEGSNAVFRIYRNGNRSGTGQVRFYTTNGTARSGSDYSGFNRIYSFRSGQSYLDVTVKTNKDTTKENTNISTEESPHTAVVIASATVLHKFNTSKTSASLQFHLHHQQTIILNHQ